MQMCRFLTDGVQRYSEGENGASALFFGNLGHFFLFYLLIYDMAGGKLVVYILK